MLVGITGELQLPDKVLIFRIRRFHLCGSSCILNRCCIVAGTGMCDSTNIIPLCGSRLDILQNTNGFLESSVLDEVYRCLKVKIILVAGASALTESAISAGLASALPPGP